MCPELTSSVNALTAIWQAAKGQVKLHSYLGALIACVRN
jgi:hypothetical protein